jgi:hypothetical protein
MLIAAATVAQTDNERELLLREAEAILLRASFEEIVRDIVLAPPAAVVTPHLPGVPRLPALPLRLTQLDVTYNRRPWERSPPSGGQIPR